MKGDVAVLFFNGITKRSVVDVLIAGRVSLATEDIKSVLRQSPNVFSEAAVSLASSAVVSLLSTVLGGEDRYRLFFTADSLKLEELSACRGVPDPFHIAQLLSAAVIESMLSDIGASGVEDEKTLLCEAHSEDELYAFLSRRFSVLLNEHSARLRESFLMRRLKEPHPVLLRAEALEKGGDPGQSLSLLATLNPEQLEPSDFGRWCVLKLKAITRLDLSDTGYQVNLEYYNEMCQKNRHDSEVLRKLAFIWIRYLQKRRDFKSASKEMDFFEKKLPESGLLPNERAVFNYLRGQIEYHKGEYIGALELLNSAFLEMDSTDLEFRSDILNTAASSFTDNLFFEHAQIMLQESLRIRNELRLAKKMETLSAMGCAALKMAKYNKASELFLQALREMRENTFVVEENRILNYTAKASLFTGDFETASVLVEESLEKAVNSKKNTAFSNSIKMAILTRKGNYVAADTFFRETFLPPENHSEVFATAWGYFFEAEACYKLGRKKDAVQYQTRSILFFLSDRYVLEAGLGGITPLLWDLSEEERSYFERLIGDTELLSMLMEYRETHNDLPERFFSDFFNEKGIKDGDVKTQLTTFIEGIINAALTKNPEQARKVINSVCLL